MKIYTKGGDKGKTSLFDGTRIYKDNIRVEAYGNIDELNTHIGVLICSCADKDVNDTLSKIQAKLFSLGSILAAGANPSYPLPQIVEEDVQFLENQIDNYEANLPKLTSFVLPGGNMQNAYAHVCRTICRRGERRVISLSQEEEVDAVIVQYLNRLSDYFFVLSRKLVHDRGDAEVIWQSEKS